MKTTIPTQPGRLSWATCFAKLNALPIEEVRNIRRAAAILIAADGAEEVGSSDVNHRIFSEYRRADGDFALTVECLVGEALNASVGGAS